MSLVSLQWDKEYNTSSKIPAEWEIRFTNDWFKDYSDMDCYFSPQVISHKIRDTFLFPVRRKYKKNSRLRIMKSNYYNVGDNLFV